MNKNAMTLETAQSCMTKHLEQEMSRNSAIKKLSIFLSLVGHVFPLLVTRQPKTEHQQWQMHQLSATQTEKSLTGLCFFSTPNSCLVQNTAARRAYLIASDLTNLWCPPQEATLLLVGPANINNLWGYCQIISGKVRVHKMSRGS